MKKRYLALALISCLGFANQNVVTTMSGLKGPALTNTRTRIRLDLKTLGRTPSPKAIRSFYNNTVFEIKQALKPYGYFHARVFPELFHRQDSTTWRIHYRIEKGPPTKLTRISITLKGQGKNDPALKQLIQQSSLKVGTTLHTNAYKTLKQHLLDLTTERGYFNAKLVKAKIYINLTTNRAKVVIVLSTGKRFRFGQTHFDSSYYKKSFLERYLPYKADEYYNSELIANLQQSLSGSVYFNDVSILPEPQKNATTNVLVKLKESRTYQYQIGAGYGTDTGLRGLLGLKLPHLTRSGDHFDSYMRISQRDRAIVANYYIPGRNPVSNQYVLSTGVGATTINGQANNFKVAASYQTNLSGFQQNISLTYLNEYYRLLNEPKISTNLIMPGISWNRTISDNLLQPSQGYQIAISIFGADKQFLSQTSFLQSNLTLKWLHTYCHNYRILLRGQLNRTFIQNLSHLPLSLQLFAGGASSIRGYTYQSIGPGRNLFIGSIELQRRLTGHWYATTFYDEGDVSNHLFSNMKRGAGLGVLWLSPVGAIELTAASALDLPGKPWRVQFTIGPEL